MGVEKRKRLTMRESDRCFAGKASQKTVGKRIAKEKKESAQCASTFSFLAIMLSHALDKVGGEHSDASFDGALPPRVLHR